MAKREWVLGLDSTEMVSAIVDPAHEYIGCEACGSCWLGHLYEAQEEPCPYCECDGEIVPVNLRTGFPMGTEGTKIADECYQAGRGEFTLLNDALGLLAGAVEWYTQYWPGYPDDRPVWVDDAVLLLQRHDRLGDAHGDD